LALILVLNILGGFKVSMEETGRARGACTEKANLGELFLGWLFAFWVGLFSYSVRMWCRELVVVLGC